jgi:hypothetical protein
MHKTSIQTEQTKTKNRPADPVPVTSLWLFYGEDTELQALLFWLWRIVGQNILLLRLLNVVFVVKCSAYHGLVMQREQHVLLREEKSK